MPEYKVVNTYCYTEEALIVADSPEEVVRLINNGEVVLERNHDDMLDEQEITLSN